jgi:hypothetical protein
MPDPAPAATPARVVRAPFAGFVPRSSAGAHLTVPAGRPWYAGPGLAALGRQISSAPPCAALNLSRQPSGPPPGARA